MDKAQNTYSKHVVPFILAAFSIVFYLFGFHIQAGSSEGIIGSTLYQFCHVSIWHLLGNLIALQSITASPFRTPSWTWVAAYFVSVVVPCGSPTEGLSGLLYAEMGILSWQALYKWKFHAWCIGFMAICFLFPNAINAWIHVWCYAGGVLIGLVALWRRK